MARYFVASENHEQNEVIRELKLRLYSRFNSASYVYCVNDTL